LSVIRDPGKYQVIFRLVERFDGEEGELKPARLAAERFENGDSAAVLCVERFEAIIIERFRAAGKVGGCDAAGFSTTAIDTQAAVRLMMKGGGSSIEHIGLRLEATVPGIDEATFQKIAAKAKQDCPLSKALAGVPEITLTAILR